MGTNWQELCAVKGIGNPAPVEEASTRKCPESGCVTMLSASNPAAYCRLHNPAHVIAAQDRAHDAIMKRNRQRLRLTRRRERLKKADAAKEKNNG